MLTIHKMEILPQIFCDLIFNPTYTSKLLQNVKSTAGVYSELIIQMDKTTSLCRFIPDDLSLIIYSSKAEDTILRDMVRNNENLDTIKGLERLLEIRTAYIEKFNRSPVTANEELVKYITTHGYEQLLKMLGLTKQELRNAS